MMLVAASASQASPDPRRGDDDSRISVTAVAGQVDVTMAGEAVIVERGATMLLPARIVTGHDGTLGLTQAGTNISVSSDTDIEIPAEAVDGNLVARLVQHRGNVFYDVAPRDVGKLRVETPFLVAVIKGTQFNVAVGDDRTTISLFEGRLELRTPDDSDVFELNAGEIAIRSLIDDAIHIVGMNDERAEAPRAAEPVAEGAAPAAAVQRGLEPVAAAVVAARAAPRLSDSEDRTAPANEGVATADRGKKDSVVATAGIEVSSVADTASVEPGPALVALDRRNDHALDRGVVELTGVDADLAVDVGSGEIGLDLGLDVGGGDLDVALEVLPAVDDAGPDLGGDLGIDTDIDLAVDTAVEIGGALDLDTDLTVDPTLDLGVDTELDVSAPALDLGLDVASPGTVDMKLPDAAKPLPVSTPGLGLARLL
jgi:hypothetical protein